MSIINYIKAIFTGRRNWGIQVTLFSLIGTMTLCLNNKLTYVLQNWLDGYMGYPSWDEYVVYRYFVAGIVLFLFSIGYIYDNIHDLFSGGQGLVEPALSSITTYIKMLPLFVVWSIYELVLIFAGYDLFIASKYFYLYFALFLCLLPFISIIFAEFARDYKYRAKYFNPLFIFKVINKTLLDVVILCIKLLILAVIPASIVFFTFKYSGAIHCASLCLGLRLLMLCISVYMLYIFKYTYSAGIVNIIKKDAGNN